MAVETSLECVSMNREPNRNFEAQLTGCAETIGRRCQLTGDILERALVALRQLLFCHINTAMYKILVHAQLLCFVCNSHYVLGSLLLRILKI
jgi:hypothetical protein